MELAKNSQNTAIKVGSCHQTCVLVILCTVVIATKHCGGSEKSKDWGKGESYRPFLVSCYLSLGFSSNVSSVLVYSLG